MHRRFDHAVVLKMETAHQSSSTAQIDVAKETKQPIVLDEIIMS